MVYQCTPQDFSTILEIINDGAFAYKGFIPEDRWKDPYMTGEELALQMEENVVFWSYWQDNEMVGVMGLQDKKKVVLIRHAYVRTQNRSKGVGSILLNHLCNLTTKPILIGTWAGAFWAIRFYEKHGFQMVPEIEKNQLLKTYWKIPERQVETSVVMAGNNWKGIC